MTETLLTDIALVLGLVQTLKACFKDSNLKLPAWANVLLNIAFSAVAVYSPAAVKSILFVAAGATVCYELGYNPLLDYLKKKAANQ